MAKETSDLDNAAILKRFVQIVPYTQPTYWRVVRSGKYSGLVGRAVCNINLRHDPGFEVVLAFEDGSMESFASQALAPGVPSREQKLAEDQPLPSSPVRKARRSLFQAFRNKPGIVQAELALG